VGNVTMQFSDHYTRGCSYSLSSITATTVAGAGKGLFPGYKIPGITVGRNSFSAVFKQMVTKFGNGTASSVTWDTAVQMFIGRAAATGLIPGAAGAAIASATTTTSNAAGRSCGGCQ
jgi:hypothetical protein